MEINKFRESMLYLVCDKCGIKRNKSVAPECPICSFDDSAIKRAIQKEFFSKRGKDTVETIKELIEMRSALGNNIKQLWKLSLDIDKQNEAALKARRSR